MPYVSAEEVEDAAKQMIGYNLITKQTTAEGLPCSEVGTACRRAAFA